jgi:predicted lipoprotein with Yx(FWY)xxD motif
MKSAYFIVVALTALTLLVSACAPAPTPTAAPPPLAPATQVSAPATQAPAPATQAPATASVMTPSGPATVNATTNPKFASPILTDSKGMTLYIFLNDTSASSTCSGACANNWPALLTNGAPIAGNGVDSTKLGTTVRADGTTQVTYNGHPLYYFSKDVQPGDINGQGIKNVWYVVSPAGDAINVMKSG